MKLVIDTNIIISSLISDSVRRHIMRDTAYVGLPVRQYVTHRKKSKNIQLVKRRIVGKGGMVMVVILKNV